MTTFSLRAARCLRAILSALILVCAFASSAEAQQQRPLLIDIIDPACPGSVINAVIRFDGRNLPPSTATTVGLGSHDLLIALQVPPDQTGHYVIRKIYEVDAITGGQAEIATPNEAQTTVTVSVAPSDQTMRLVAEIEATKCTTMGSAKVLIATTTSCTGTNGEDFKVQGGVEVNIGGRVYVSNDKGVIEAELPVGDYEVAARWADAAVAYVSQSGVPTERTEMGLNKVHVGAAVTQLEVRLATCNNEGQGKVRAVIATTNPGLIRILRRGNTLYGAVGTELRDGDTVNIQGVAELTWIADKHTIKFERGTSSIIHIGPLTPPPPGAKAPSGGALILIEGIIHLLGPRMSDQEFKKLHPDLWWKDVRILLKGTEFTMDADGATGTLTVTVVEGLISIEPTGLSRPAFDLHANEQVILSEVEVGAITSIEGKDVVLPAGTYLGCFADTTVFDLDGYLERSPSNTPDRCIQTCRAQGFKFAGVQYGESCLCGNSYGRYGPAMEDCDFVCTGDGGQVCGGYNANSIFATGN